MYEWFNKATAEVKWRNFFQLERDSDRAILEQLGRQFGVLPDDYRQFITEFGHSLLFRHLTRGSYNMAVFSHPRILEGKNGALLLEIGFFINGGYAHFRKPKDIAEIEPGVFEGAGLQVRKTADSFEDWLKQRFDRSKKLYKKPEWKRIVEGALPFTSDELKIVAAIEKFDFEKTGTAPNGNMLIKVHNGSETRLRCFTIGARAKGRLEGGVYLDVSGIDPGETKIVEHDCYKSLVAAEKVELFRKPLPKPEDRGCYHEFDEIKQ